MSSTFLTNSSISTGISAGKPKPKFIKFLAKKPPSKKAGNGSSSGSSRLPSKPSAPNSNGNSSTSGSASPLTTSVTPIGKGVSLHVESQSTILKTSKNISASTYRPYDDERVTSSSSSFLDDNDPNVEYIEYTYHYDDEENENYWKKDRLHYASSISDFNSFKTKLKNVIKEYILHKEQKDILEDIKNLDVSIFHAEIPYILMKMSMDEKPSDRSLIIDLLLRLSSSLTSENSSSLNSSLASSSSSPKPLPTPLLTAAHFKHSVKKLYRQLDDLLLDIPQAHSILTELSKRFLSANILEINVIDECEKKARQLNDEKKVTESKKLFEMAIDEYLDSEDIDNLKKLLLEFNADYLHDSFIYRLIRISMDRNDRERELSAHFLSEAVSDRGDIQNGGKIILSREQLCAGFTLLLERTEDVALDVPNILQYLAIFIARAISDEILEPAFLLRVDLCQRDDGVLVLKKAQEILKRDDNYEYLQTIWKMNSSSHQKYFLESSVEIEEEMTNTEEKSSNSQKQQKYKLQEQFYDPQEPEIPEKEEEKEENEKTKGK